MSVQNTFDELAKQDRQILLRQTRTFCADDRVRYTDHTGHVGIGVVLSASVEHRQCVVKFDDWPEPLSMSFGQYGLEMDRE